MPGELIDSEAIFAPLAEFRRIGLAVSGGPDSLALMLLAAEFAGRHAAHDRFVVYSVDHGLRPEAAGEVAYVADAAQRLGFEARQLKWEGAKPATGVQDAARKARYRLIGGAMSADGAEVLVTAHHIEDQAETVLMRLAHGSGLAGLKGMLPLTMVDGLLIARPLLGVSKAWLAEIVQRSGIVPVNDPSNGDQNYERVRWRAALPAFAELGLDARRLAMFAARAADAHEAVAQAAATTVANWSKRSIDVVTIESKRLVRLPRAVLVEALSR